MIPLFVCTIGELKGHSSIYWYGLTYSVEVLGLVTTLAILPEAARISRKDKKDRSSKKTKPNYCSIQVCNLTKWLHVHRHHDYAKKDL